VIEMKCAVCGQESYHDKYCSWGCEQAGEKKKRDYKHTLLWNQLYSTLTTSQINQVLRRLDLKHQDWMEFCSMMEGEQSK
jgi:ribosomal protein L37E